MTEIAIRTQALSKRYRIGVSPRGYDTLRDAVSEGLATTLRAACTLARARPRRVRTDDTIRALKEVTFQIERGEAVGIIGQNGSGKSTLLKVLSRITKPTTGSAEITGRVGSLLEVGTGFPPYKRRNGRPAHFRGGRLDCPGIGPPPGSNHEATLRRCDF
jgi:lipopolysaccharide transport system ATP-binding protein